MARDRFFRALAAGKEGVAVGLLRDHPDLARASGSLPDAQDGVPAPVVVLAAELGMVHLLDALAEAGASLRARGQHGGTALHWAAAGGRSEAVYLLLAHAAPTEVRCVEHGATPLHWAVRASANEAPAVRAGALRSVRALLEAGARAETSDRAGVAALDLAPAGAAGDALRRLLNGG